LGFRMAGHIGEGFLDNTICRNLDGGGQRWQGLWCFDFYV